MAEVISFPTPPSPPAPPAPPDPPHCGPSDAETIAALRAEVIGLEHEVLDYQITLSKHAVKLGDMMADRRNMNKLLAAAAVAAFLFGLQCSTQPIAAPAGLPVYASGSCLASH